MIIDESEVHAHACSVKAVTERLCSDEFQHYTRSEIYMFPLSVRDDLEGAVRQACDVNKRVPLGSGLVARAYS